MTTSICKTSGPFRITGWKVPAVIICFFLSCLCASCLSGQAAAYSDDNAFIGSDTAAFVETGTGDGFFPSAADLEADTASVFETEDYVFERTTQYGNGYKLVSVREDMEEAVIPAMINGLPVLQIGEDAFPDHTGLVKVVIPESVLDPGYNPFRGCTGLQTLILSDSISRMCSLNDCTSLTEIRLSAGITHLIGNWDSPGVFKGTSVSFLEIPESVLEVGPMLFKDSIIREVILPVSLLTFSNDCMEEGNNQVETYYYRGTEAFFSTIELYDEYEDPEKIQALIASKVCFYAEEKPVENPDRYWHEEDGHPVRWSEWEGGNGQDPRENNGEGENSDPEDPVIAPEQGNALLPFEAREIIQTEDFTFEWASEEHDSLVLTRVREDIVDAVVPQRVNGVRVIRIDDGAFMDHALLRSAVVSAGIREFGKDLFRGCTDLETVVLPDSAVYIGEGLLAGCTSLKTVRLSAKGNRYVVSGIEVGESWFEGSAVRVLEIPEGINTLHINAFKDSNIEAVVLPESIRFMARGKLNASYEEPGNAITYAGIPAVYLRGCESEWAWFAAKYLQGTEVFYYSETRPADHPERYWQYVNGEPRVWSAIHETELAYIGIRSFFTEVSHAVTEETEAVKTADFTFVRHPYYGGLVLDRVRTAAETVVIPDSVNEIPVIGISSGAFSGAKARYVIISDEVLESFYYDTLYAESSSKSRIEGVFGYCTGGNGLVFKYAGYGIKDIRVPAEVAGLPVLEIGRAAFASRSEIRSIILPGSVEKIGDDAFMDLSSLITLTLPDSVAELGSNICNYCRRLKSITLSSGTTELKVTLFRYSGIEELEIPEGVQKVGSEVFSYTDIKAVSLPSTLTEIDDTCFNDSRSSVEVFFYPGTREDWENVTVTAESGIRKRQLEKLISEKVVFLGEEADESP